MTDLEQLEERDPGIPWRTPVILHLSGSSSKGYGCRVCIANDGIRATDDVAGSPEEWEEHMLREHGAEATA